jgi:AraC-like DNA-binding protein
MTGLNWNVRFLSCGRIAPTMHWSMKNHRHDRSHEIIVVLRGSLEVEIAGKTLLAGAGHALLYPKGQWHREKAVGDDPLETWYFGWTECGKGGRPMPASSVFDRDGTLRLALPWLYDMAYLRNEKPGAALDALTFAVVSEYISLTRPVEADFVREAKRLAETSLSSRVPLADMARAAGLSLFRFAHAFKEKTGCSPGEYVTRRRIERVKALLLSAPMPLKAVAAQVGYADEFTLAKAFKKFTGMTPGAFRGAGGAKSR